MSLINRVGRSRFFTILSLLSAVWMAGGVGTARAAMGTWTGAAGATWDTTAANWSGVSGTPWDSGNGPSDTALFAGSPTPSVSGTVYAGGFYVGSGSGISTTLVISNGTLNLGGGTDWVNIGGKRFDGSGSIASSCTLTISGGNVNFLNNGSGTVYFNPYGGAASALNLNGGTVSTAIGFTDGAGSGSSFNFNGGTLKFTAVNNLPFNGAINLIVLAGGAIFDTAGNNVLVGGTAQGGDRNFAMVHGGSGTDGGLTKNGAGSLTVPQSYTYNGPTLVNAGTLALSGSGAIASSASIALASGATLNVSGLAGGTLTLAQPLSAKGSGTATVTGTLNAGNKTLDLQDQTNIGTLAISGGLTLAGGGTLTLDLGATGASDQITIGGAAALSGTTTLNVAALSSLSGLATGTHAYTLLTAGSGLSSGNFALSSASLIVNGTIYNMVLSGDATHVYLDVTDGGAATTTTAGGTTTTTTAAATTTTTTVTTTTTTTTTAAPATGTWTGAAGATWDTTAANWSGVSGTPWDSGRGPSDTAIFTGSPTPSVSGTVYAGGFYVGSGSGSPTTLVIGNGTLNLGGGTDWVAIGGERMGGVGAIANSCTLTINGGNVNVAAGTTWYFNPYGGTASTLNLNGGTLSMAVSPIEGASSGSGFNFNGGTLRLTAALSSMFNGYFNLNVLAGGAIFDTAGNNCVLHNANGGYNARLLHSSGNPDGGLTKLGAGQLTLDPGQANTYTGPTVVSAGTLALSGAATIANSASIALASGATLDVSALSSGALTLAQPLSAKGSGAATVTGTLNAGNNTLDLQDQTNIGTLAISGGLTLAGGGTLKLDLGATGASDQITIGGAAALSGTTTLNVAALSSLSGLATGAHAYTLLTAGSGLSSSSFALSSSSLIVNGTIYNLVLSGDATHVYLDVTDGGAATTTTTTTAAATTTTTTVTTTTTTTTTAAPMTINWSGVSQGGWNDTSSVLSTSTIGGTTYGKYVDAVTAWGSDLTINGVLFHSLTGDFQTGGWTATYAGGSISESGSGNWHGVGHWGSATTPSSDMTRLLANAVYSGPGSLTYDSDSGEEAD